MPILIRLLADTDLEKAEKILSLAFRRSGNWITDLRLYHSIQPDGYFLAEENGIPVGMVGAVVYSAYAYIGMMAVHPDHQRKGIGLALMQHVLAWLDQQQVPLVLLDASPAGQPLYEKLGFVPHDQACIFQRGEGQPAVRGPRGGRVLSVADLERIAAGDAQAFGADRSRVLRLLLEAHPGRSFAWEDEGGQAKGHLFVQQNRIGPWVMQGVRGAEALLQAALSLPFTGPVSAAVPGGNAAAIALLQRYGFEQVRVNRHMARGPGMPVGRREEIFAQASLSLG